MSSSPFPILDNRPIDKWKVTELKEELKRRRLTTQGLKVDLVRRLDDALRAEQEAPQTLANQQAEIPHAPDVSVVTPDPMPAAFSIDTTPSEIQTTPVVKTTAAIETTPPPPPVVSKPEVNASGLDDVRGVAGLGGSVVDDVKVQEPQDADVKGGVGSGVTATDAVIADKAPQPTDTELEKAATYNQVSVTGYESQEPSAVTGGESHPMDVEKPPEQKMSVGGGDVSDAAANAADVTKGNNTNISDAGDSEKLNLDRSSGDESMEDEPESKQTESVTSHEVVVDKSEKNDIVDDAGKGEALENKSHPLVASEKRKLPDNDQEAVGNNEPVKRQRRWNSGSVKVPEAQATNSVAAPATTPMSTSLKRDFSRSNSSVVRMDLRNAWVFPPSSKEPTDSLRIDRFLRPFTLKAVQELLGKTGNVTSFWMDSIKTHCYVSKRQQQEKQCITSSGHLTEVAF
ncbi:SAP domain-containing protein [Raphanus sativus]|nr:SAP domain-containing protein [Raphanus sativus]